MHVVFFSLIDAMSYRIIFFIETLAFNHCSDIIKKTKKKKFEPSEDHADSFVRSVNRGSLYIVIN